MHKRYLLDLKHITMPLYRGRILCNKGNLTIENVEKNANFIFRKPFCNNFQKYLKNSLHASL